MGLQDSQGRPDASPTAQRVTGVVDDPSTLRGWLAAWNLAHDTIGHSWLGDIDPRLRMARVGVGIFLPPAQTRKRASRIDTIRLVQYASSRAKRKWVIWAGMAACAYVFGFRVPSELLRQWGHRARFTSKGSTFTYGPLLRKGKIHPGVITRERLCGPATYAPIFGRLSLKSRTWFLLRI